MAKAKIDKKIKLGELFEKYPEAAEILFNRGLHCLGCGLAAFETLEQGALAHGLSEEEIDQLVAGINQFLEQHTKEESDHRRQD